MRVTGLRKDYWKSCAGMGEAGEGDIDGGWVPRKTCPHPIPRPGAVALFGNGVYVARLWILRGDHPGWGWVVPRGRRGGGGAGRMAETKGT